MLSVLKWHKLKMVMDWKSIYLLSLLQMTFLVAPIRYKHSFRNILYIKFKIRQVVHLHQQETDYIRKTEYVINIERVNGYIQLLQFHYSGNFKKVTLFHMLLIILEENLFVG